MPLVALSLTLLLAGCGADDANRDSPLLGRWITEACELASDGSAWLRGEYEFTRDGVIRKGLRRYADSACGTESGRQAPQGSGFYFTDRGEASLDDGTLVRGLRVSGPAGLPAEEGYYDRVGERVCFSDVFRFRVETMGIASTGVFPGVDYGEGCLRAL